MSACDFNCPVIVKCSFFKKPFFVIIAACVSVSYSICLEPSLGTTVVGFMLLRICLLSVVGRVKKFFIVFRAASSE